MITPEQLGHRLRQAREQSEIIQEVASNALYLDSTAISKIEHGTRDISAIEILKLAHLYNVPVGTLLGEVIQFSEDDTEMKRLYLERAMDPVGISGTGKIAEGVMLTNGKIVLQWLTQYRSLGVYDSISDVLSIHGHNGLTSVVFIDQ